MSDLEKRSTRPRPRKGEPPGSWSKRLGEWNKERQRNREREQEPHKFEGLRTEQQRERERQEAQSRIDEIRGEVRSRYEELRAEVQTLQQEVRDTRATVGGLKRWLAALYLVAGVAILLLLMRSC